MRSLLLGALFASGFCFSDILHVSPDKDNTLYEDAAGSLSNGLGVNLFSGRTSQSVGSIRRALLHFDVSSIPAGSVINTVSINLVLNRNNSGSQNCSLHSLLQDWGEGNSVAAGNGGAGTSASLNDATWVYTFSDGVGGGSSSWDSIGGSFNPIASQTMSVDALGVYTFVSSAKLVTDVQTWLDSGMNFGWVLVGNESALSTSLSFSSKDHLIAADRPVLTIDYSPPTPVELINFSID
jgi:hypothetical protein